MNPYINFQQKSTTSQQSNSLVLHMQGGIPTIIPQQILQLKQIFGINNSVPNSINLLYSDRLFYVAGYQGVVYNPKEKEKSLRLQKYRQYRHKSQQKIHGYGNEGNDKPSIYFYQLNASAKRRKIQITQNFSFTAWSSVAFAHSDTKMLASITSKNANGQAILAFWNPQRGKCEGQIKFRGRQHKDFSQILFNPNSQNFLVSIVGEKTVKVYEMKEISEQKKYIVEEVKLQGEQNMTSMYTLNYHQYAGVSQHIIFLANEATLITDYKANIVQTIHQTGTCVANWSEGFVLGSESIRIYRFEDQKFNLKHTYEFQDKQTRACSINVNQDKLLVSLRNGTMMLGRIKFETAKDTVRLQLQMFGLAFHSAPIVSMDICVRKPLIATASKDKTIKIWNYEDRTVETPKSQAEAASCLSFHPQGLHLAVAYSDKLRIMNLQKDGQSMSNFKDVNSFRNCTFVKFSNGGQYFAASSGNLVHVFKFYTGENPPGMTFSGHSGKIKGMAWSKQDNILVTCGTDGIILAYRVGMQNCGSKLLYMHSSKEPRTKGVSYSSVAITMDNTIYAMGIVGGIGERVFKEIKLDDTDNKRQLSENNCCQISLPSTAKILFCGSDDKQNSSGSIKCYKFPSTQHMEQFQAHDNLGIEKLCVTADDKFLVSAGRDGTVMIFEIRDKEARSDKLKQTLPASNQILITKTDLNTLKAEVQNLKQQRNELEGVGGVGGVGSIKDDHVKQLKDKYSSDQSQFQQKHNAITQKKNLLRKKFDQQIRTKKEDFENTLQQFDSNQAKNVMQQSAKYDQLKRALEQQMIQFQRQINKVTNENQRQIKKLEEDYREKIKNEKDQKNNVKTKIQRLEKENQQTMRQIIEEKMEQIIKLENENAQHVQNITESSLRSKSDVSIIKKRIAQKDQQRQNHVQKQRQNQDQTERLRKANQDLEMVIEKQGLQIQEKDRVIDSNQRKIYEFKKKAQQLQKFKYVLDHKIKDLQKDIAPREQEITRMKNETNKMDKKLKDLNSLNTGLAQFVADLFKNEETLKKKISSQRARISFQYNKIETFKDALHNTVQLIQNETELKTSATQLQDKFVSQNMTQVKMDSQIEQQYKNQKKYLEKSIIMLKKNVQKDNEIHKHQNIRIMKENVDLIKEISSLRFQIRQDNQKKGNQDETKNKNEPKQEELRLEIKNKIDIIQVKRKEIEDLEERINSL